MPKARKLAKQVRQGRKRMLGQREANGRLQRPPREDVKRTVRSQPHRRGDDSPERGYALGRLRQAGAITQQQEAAGNAFGALWEAVLRSGGVNTGFSPTAVERLSKTTGDRPPLPKDREEALANEWQKAMEALADLGMLPSLLFIRVCWLDYEPSFGDELYALRRGLQAFSDKGLTWAA